jgi:hypothetical protein
VRAGLLALAVVLLALSFLPGDALVDFGERVMRRGALEAVTVEALHEVPWILRALAALVLALAWIRPESGTGTAAPAAAAGIAVVIGVAATLAVRAFVLRSGMISGDEWNNEFTARLIEQGRAWATPPPHPDFFRFAYFVTLPDRTFSIFPPLWPAILAFGHAVGIGGAVNALVAGAAAALVAAWNRSSDAALATALVLVLSPMFLFTGASWFASPTVLLATIGELWCLRRALEPEARTGAWLAAAGCAWGLLFTAHYPTAVGAGGPPLLYALWRLVTDRRSLAPVAAAVVGAAVPLAALGAYHHAVHGGPPWLLPAFLYGESILLAEGFDARTLVKGAAYTALHAARLLAWTFPLAVILALVPQRGRAVRDDALLWLALVGLVALYALYPSAGGPQYGPRYYFALLAPIAILAGRRLARLAGTRSGRAFASVLVASALVLLAVRARTESERAARENAPFRLAEQARLSNAIVFMRNVNKADHARNPPGWYAPVLYVPDLEGREAELLALYPRRTPYLYRRGDGGPEIVPLHDP